MIPTAEEARAALAEVLDMSRYEYAHEFLTEGSAWVALHGATLLSYIDAAEAAQARYREALQEIAFNTSLSVPMGSWPVHHHADNVRRCISIAANALREPEVKGDE